MADNRLYLVCNVCHPPGSDFTYSEACFLGKYYVSTGWYHKDQAGARLNDFFAAHEHLDEAHIRGFDWLRLEYETDR